jgi:hypothetical protein
MPGTLSLIKEIGPRPGYSQRIYNFVPSGAYVQGGAVGVAGETLNFLTAANPNGLPHPAPGALPTPTDKDVFVEKCPGGYTAVIEQNAVNPTIKNMVLRFFTSSNTEISSAAYPAGLLGQNVLINMTTQQKQG